MDKPLYDKLEVFLKNLKDMLEGRKFPFTVILRDPSGNSHIQNLCAPNPDLQLTKTEFVRSMVESQAMGFYAENAETFKEVKKEDEFVKVNEEDYEPTDKEEVIV